MEEQKAKEAQTIGRLEEKIVLCQEDLVTTIKGLTGGVNVR